MVFYLQWLLVVYVLTNCLLIAGRGFYRNTSGCTVLTYYVDLNFMWVLAWGSQTQRGKWSWCVYCILCILGQYFATIFAWKFLVSRLWYCVAMMNSSVSDSRRDDASHRWVKEEIKSGSLAQIGCLPWRGLFFYPSFI